MPNLAIGVDTGVPEVSKFVENFIFTFFHLHGQKLAPIQIKFGM